MNDYKIVCNEEDLNDNIKLYLNVLKKVCHGNAKDAGWYTDLKTGKSLDRNVGEMMALIHSEISEAMEGYRKNKMDDHLPNRKNVEIELADAIIRIMDLAGYLKLNIGRAVIEKLEYNKTRADHKIENRKKHGGKSFW